jgi:hypothetical protein
MPRIQPILREFEKRKQDEAWETAKGQIVVSREFLDELFIERLVNMKTHPKVGDLAIVKMFETAALRPSLRAASPAAHTVIHHRQRFALMQY